MWGRRRGRPTRREQIQGFNALIRFYAAATDKDPTPHLQEVPKARAKRRSSGRVLERDVLKAVMQALRLDPRVASVERNQSGVFRDGDRFVRVGTPGKLDLTVYLKSGRYAEIEVKRDERERPKPHQLERIEAIKRAGGIAGWCWSVESALEILP